MRGRAEGVAGVSAQEHQQECSSYSIASYPDRRARHVGGDRDRGGVAELAPVGRPAVDAVITVEAKGLPSDGGFVALVEQHEDVHVRELAEVVHEILLPWDTRIAQFRVQGRKFVGENEVAAAALLYEALGGTAAQVGARFNNALRDRGLAFQRWTNWMRYCRLWTA